MTIENVKRRLDVQAIYQIEQQVQHCLRSYENDLREEKLIALVQEWLFRGLFIEEGMDVADGRSVKRRFDIQAIYQIEQQVQYCLRSYENDLLKEKLIALVQEWFFKGLFMYEIIDVADGVTEHAQP